MEPERATPGQLSSNAAAAAEASHTARTPNAPPPPSASTPAPQNTPQPQPPTTQQQPAQEQQPEKQGAIQFLESVKNRYQGKETYKQFLALMKDFSAHKFVSSLFSTPQGRTDASRV